MKTYIYKHTANISMTSSALFYSFVSFTECRHEETNLGRSKTESGSSVFIFHQRKRKFFCNFFSIFLQFFFNFSAIVVWIWTQQVFLDSWSYDNGGLRELAGKRTWRPAKQPLLWLSDQCHMVEFYFPVSGSFWAIFDFSSDKSLCFSDSIGWFCPIWVLKKSKTA